MYVFFFSRSFSPLLFLSYSIHIYVRCYPFQKVVIFNFWFLAFASSSLALSKTITDKLLLFTLSLSLTHWWRRNCYVEALSLSLVVSVSLSLSLSLTHTHTHTHCFGSSQVILVIVTLKLSLALSLSLTLSLCFGSRQVGLQRIRHFSELGLNKHNIY
jgi:hypothetical protein